MRPAASEKKFPVCLPGAWSLTSGQLGAARLSVFIKTRQKVQQLNYLLRLIDCCIDIYWIRSRSSTCQKNLISWKKSGTVFALTNFCLGSCLGPSQDRFCFHPPFWQISSKKRAASGQKSWVKFANHCSLRWEECCKQILWCLAFLKGLTTDTISAVAWLVLSFCDHFFSLFPTVSDVLLLGLFLWWRKRQSARQFINTKFHSWIFISF